MWAASLIPVFTKGGYRPGFWTVVSELRLINLARENENEMQISYYLLSRSKKPQIQFCFRNISSLIAKSPQHKISAQTAPLLQPEHSCTQGEGRSGVLEISLLQRDHFVPPFQIPAAPALTPCLALQSPALSFIPLRDGNSFQISLAFSKQTKKVNLLSYPKGINSGTRMGEYSSTCKK